MRGIRSVSGWLERVSPGWVVLATLVIFVLFTALVAPGQSAAMRENAHGVGTPDLSLLLRSDLFCFGALVPVWQRPCLIHLRNDITNPRPSALGRKRLPCPGRVCLSGRLRTLL